MALLFTAQGTAAQGAPATPCENGFAGSFPCAGLDLEFQITPGEFGASSGNDVWGWVDPVTMNEYAIYGLNSGIAIVDVTDPSAPVLLGSLPSHTNTNTWRDMKVHDGYAYVVSEASGHGMQILDLGQLAGITNPPIVFTETGHYDDFGSAHHLVVNEATGYAYAVGSNTCSGGLHMIDLASPTAPVFAGCFSADGYTQDAQCVIYTGPDSDYAGSEICFNGNEDTLTIVDVTLKSSPIQISRTGYSGSSYANNAWLSGDQATLYLTDELDESNSGHNTRTRSWDVRDLDAPVVVESFYGPTVASDTELLVHDDVVYLAAFAGGLRILSTSRSPDGLLTVSREWGYFDTYPSSDVGFTSAWGVYPYLPSGLVLIGTSGEGLFGVRFKPPIFVDDFESGSTSAWTAASQ